MKSFRRKILRRIFKVTVPFIPPGVFQRILPVKVTGFFYHSVSNQPLPHVAPLYPHKTPDEFEADLVYLKRHFTLVSYQELYQSIENGLALPPNAAFISFDDGCAECYSTIRPMLLHYAVPAIFFLVTEVLDNRKMMYRNSIALCLDALHRGKKIHSEMLHTRSQDLDINLQQLKSIHQEDSRVEQLCTHLGIDLAQYLSQQQPYLTTAQVQEMSAEGFTFGAHTLNHPKLLGLSQAEQARQIVQSCQVVADITQKESVPFAFPFSGAGVSREFLARLRSDNPQVGLFFDTNNLRHDAYFVLNRIWADKPLRGVAPPDNLRMHLLQAYRWTLVDRYTNRVV